MKSERSLSEIAGKVLANEARDTQKPSEDVRARAVEAIARTILQQKRARRVRQAAMIGAAGLAAGLALVVGLSRSTHPTAGKTEPSSSIADAAAPMVMAAAAASFVRGNPAVVRQGVRRDLSEGAPVEAGDRVLVEEGSRTTLALAGGTYLALRDRADVLLVSAGPSTIFQLESGSVQADVAKLKASERFVVRTSDAEVEVHGTSFEVSRVASDPGCGGGTSTRVKVREGVVAVRSGGSETLLHANESWPRGCSLAAPTPPAASVSSFSLPKAPTPAARGEASAPASDLAAQNDRFENAVARKRSGDKLGALTAFDEFLAAYPTSHLAQSARAERMKLLREIDMDRARTAARDYLQTYPNGFARRDAELILNAE